MNELSDQIAKTKLGNWTECYSTDLEKHFIKSKGSQFDRLCSLELSEAAQVFQAISGNESPIDFRLMMGLDSLKPTSDKFSFRPIFSSSSKQGSIRHFELQHLENDPDTNPSQLSAKIPYELYDWLTKNWREMEAESVDDIYMANLEDSSLVKTGSLKRLVAKRVLGYYFTETINSQFWQFLNDYRGQIQKIIFHLGADMNKKNHPELFTFCPIFEVHFTPKDVNRNDDILYLHRLGLRSYRLDDSKEVAYYEYMAPCPSTCPTLTWK